MLGLNDHSGLLRSATTTDPKETVRLYPKNACSSAKGDNGLTIDRVRCIRKTGRWLAPR